MAAFATSQHTGLKAERCAQVLWLAFDRPRASNAIDAALARAFADALRRAAEDADIGAVVIAGQGEKVFSAGIDVKNPEGLDHEALSGQRRSTVTACLTAIIDFEKPLVAAVNGAAIGLGCMLALLADRVVATDEAIFSLPEIEIGIPTFLGISILSRAFGDALARDLVLTGRRMTAAEALQRGVVGAVCETGELHALAQSTAEALAAKPKTTYALDKRWLSRGLRDEVAAANEQSKAVQRLLAGEKTGSSHS